MNMSGNRILKTTAVVLGISALGALGSATAFAATPADLGSAPDIHGTSPAAETGQVAPASSQDGDLHTFAMPKMATHAAKPSSRYDNNNYNNDNSSYDSSGSNSNGYGSNSNGYDSNSDNNNSNYNNNYDNGYSNGYRHNSNGLLGGGLLGGNN